VDVLFDLNGTLLDPAALTAAWPSGSRGLALNVLDQAIAQAMVDTITGDFRPFLEYVHAALAHRAAVAGLPEEYVAAGVTAAHRLPAFPDAAPALERLAGAGHRVSVLTNSAAETALDALDAAALDRHVHRVFGADAVRAYKPDRRVYLHAQEELQHPGSDPAATPAGAAPGPPWLVAAHWWDVAGAKRAGLRTAWVGRDEAVLLDGVPLPDVTAHDLIGAADAIMASGH
jgi:2-haloacid dehalogenase